MNLVNRSTRIQYIPCLDELLVVDTAGGLHRLDRRLRVARSSPRLREQWPINAITFAGRFAYTRDRIGAITRWDLETLLPIDFYPAVSLADPNYLMEGEEPSPTPARGIAVFEGRLYVNNGYGQLAVFDCEPFHLREIRVGLNDSFIEWICTDAPGLQVMSDKRGRLHMGNLETGHFPITVAVDDNSNLHRVRYDPEYDAFWVTQDAGDRADAFVRNGLVRVTRLGEIMAKHPFTADDVEFLELDAERSLILSGGFDGQLYVFANKKEGAELVNVIGPFPHQLIDCAYRDPEHVYALTQDGEITEVSIAKGRETRTHCYARRCIWDIQPTEDSHIFYCATDSGVAAVQLTEGVLGTIDAQLLWHHQFSVGFVRRVVPRAYGNYVGIGRKQSVFCASRTGTLAWLTPLASLVHTVSVDEASGRVLVATTQDAVELDLATGHVIRRWSHGHQPIWACTYTRSGDPIIATRGGLIIHYNRETGQEIKRAQTDPYPKRMWIGPNSSLWVTGGYGVKELDAETFELRHHWMELIENTAENASLLDGYVYVVSYGYQLVSYTYDTEEFISLSEPLLDFPKGIAVFRDQEKAWLLIGGRGGFLSIYQVKEGVPTKVREVYVV